MLQELGYALRMLRKNSGLSALVVLSLGLGIAANTTVFSFINALLFQPPNVAEPAGLYQLWRMRPDKRSAFEQFSGLSYPSYAFYRDQTRAFASLAAFDPESPSLSWSREGMGEPVQCQFASGNYFDVCGIAMELGRAFTQQEDFHPGANPVAVASYDFWQGKLGGDPQAVGRTLTVNGVDLTIVGVAPKRFRGVLAGVSPDLWAPFLMASTVLHDPEWHTRTGAFSYFGIGRLREGVSPAQAQEEMTMLTRRLEAEDPANHRKVVAAVMPAMMIPTPFRSAIGGYSALVMAGVSLVLLIAGANAANLLMARALGRRREIAVRAAVGASRLRLMRQMLAESVLLALFAGAAGLLLAVCIMPALLRMAPASLPVRPAIDFDWRVCAFTALAALAAGLAFGVFPAWSGARRDHASALKAESPASSRGHSRFASSLIVGQLALCLILLICGGLCMRSLQNAGNVPLGLQPRGRVMAEVHLKDFGYSDAQAVRFNEQYIERLRALSNVESAAVADFLPLDARSLGLEYSIEGFEPSEGEDVWLDTFNVGPEYMKTMGTSLLKGREFTDGDNAGAPLAAVVNKAMADRYWRGLEPVGRHLTLKAGGGRDVYEVVGVVETGKYRELGEQARPAVFRCRLQERGTRSTFVAHVRGDERAALAAIGAIARDLDPRLSLSRLATLDQHLAFALFPSRMTGAVFGVIGASALLLAAAGLFGLIACSVSRRQREMGIRMALGAQRGDLLRMVLRQGLKLSALGIALGLGVALLTTPLLGGLLLGVSPLDPLTFAAVPVFLLLVAAAASLVPALRAARVDPMTALRAE